MMNDSTNPTPSDGPFHNDDVVLSRLLDGRGRATDWKRLREATTADAVVWDRLIGSAGDQDVLGDVVGIAGDVAMGVCVVRAAGGSRVDASPVPLALVGTGARPDGRRADRAVRSARLGWLVAACMALGLVSLSLRPNVRDGGAQPITAGLSFDKMSASDLMNGYKTKASQDGTLVAEMPQRLVLETRPTQDGKGHEVLYMRQFIERAIVDDLYKFGVDDAGRPVMVPTSMEKSRPAGAM